MPANGTLDEELISRLVHAFYAKIRADEILSPIFGRVIGDQWTPHLAKMCDFWSSVMLTTGRYHGNPMMAHIRLKDVRPEHFERWLSMFRATAAEVCPGELGDLFSARAGNIARSLQMGMFYRPAMVATAPVPKS
jgi:hemoglobin